MSAIIPSSEMHVSSSFIIADGSSSPPTPPPGSFSSSESCFVDAGKGCSTGNENDSLLDFGDCVPSVVSHLYGNKIQVANYLVNKVIKVTSLYLLLRLHRTILTISLPPGHFPSSHIRQEETGCTDKYGNC